MSKVVGRPKEHQRRSRQDWSGFLDREELIQQEKRERGLTALRMREVGFKFREIGEYMGVGVERARDLVSMGYRSRKGPLPAMMFFRHPERLGLSFAELSALKRFFLP